MVPNNTDDKNNNIKHIGTTISPSPSMDQHEDLKLLFLKLEYVNNEISRDSDLSIIKQMIKMQLN